MIIFDGTGSELNFCDGGNNAIVSTKLIAHRGLKNTGIGVEENTIMSFVHAVCKHGFDGVELDVRSTSDGVLVVHHDPSAKTEDGTSYTISQQTWDTLHSITFYRHSEYNIPKFEDAIRVFKEIGGVATVELKETSFVVASDIMAVVKSLDAENNVIFNINGNSNNLSGLLSGADKKINIMTNIKDSVDLSTVTNNANIIYSLAYSKLGTEVTESDLTKAKENGYIIYWSTATEQEVYMCLDRGAEYIEMSFNLSSLTKKDIFENYASEHLY